MVRLVDQRIETCAVDTAKCAVGQVTIPRKGGGKDPADVRFAGQTFES